MNISFIGFTVPESIINEILLIDTSMPIQTYNFSWAIVDALVTNGTKVNLISTHPITNYPNNPLLLINKSFFSIDNVNGVLLPFINILILKHISRFISVLLLGIPRVRKFKSDVILVHGVHSPFLYFAILSKILLNKKIVVILTDPPSQSYPTDSKISLILKHFDKFLIKKSLLKFDGIIALTKALADDFAPSIPYIVLEGIASPSTSSLKNKINFSENDSGLFTIVYAGGLSKEYGIQDLIDSFKYIDEEYIRLKVYGKGPYEDKIIEASLIDKRISYMGFKPHNKILDSLMQADLLINPRPSNQAFVKYSFPSKIIEYMNTSTPVLTTKLPGIPNEYFDYIFTIDDESPKGIAHSIFTVMKLSKKDLREKGCIARDFIQLNKTGASQGHKILDFFKNTICTRS